MMTQTKKNSRTGDAAVDGLLAGLGSGVVMAVYLLITGILGGDAMGTIMGRFAPGGETTPVTGLLAHLAVSAIYGAVFGVVTLPLRKRIPVWVLGLVYGAALFLIARVALLPGTGSSLLEISPVHFGIAHLVYGGILGWQIGRKA